MPKHTSSPQRVMLTNIRGLIKQAEHCKADGFCLRVYYTDQIQCPLMGVLLAIKKSLQTEVKNLGEDDREVKS